MDTPTILKFSHCRMTAYEDGTEGSETSAYKIQTPGNYPEENIHNIYYFSTATMVTRTRLNITLYIR